MGKEWSSPSKDTQPNSGVVGKLGDENRVIVMTTSPNTWGTTALARPPEYPWTILAR